MAKKIFNSKGYKEVEYKMTKDLADSYLKMRKGEDKKKHPQEFLCNIVNTEFGIKGYCTKVLVTL